MSKFRLRVSAILALAGSLQVILGADAPSNEVVRATSSDSTNALAGFVLEPGFRIDVIAAEPLVNSPVAISFDEKGQLYVAEMRASTNRDDARVYGRIKLLKDPDAQGQFRTSTLFADGLLWPSALACYAGGVFVASVPNVLYMKDTSGDGVADVRTTVLSGLGETNLAGRVVLPNNFNWSPDGRFYTAGIPPMASVTSTNFPDSPIPLYEGELSFNPRSLLIVPESGPADSGLTFDIFARNYVSDAFHPVRQVVYPRRYWTRNPFFVAAHELRDLTAPPASLLRVGSSFAKTETGAKTNAVMNSWCTNAEGLVVYRGNAFATNYLGNVFVCDPEAHIVRRYQLSDNGLGVAASRPGNERTSEFLACKEASFRPVQALNGADGGLYIVDAEEGDRGRIYRILPRGYKGGKLPDFKSARTFDLVAALANPNGWQRETASRLLFERQDPAAVPLLSAMLSNSVVAIARLHAAHALAAMGALTEGHALKLLQDTNSNVRQTALELCEPFISNGSVSAPLWAELQALSKDPVFTVRLQLGFTLGAVHRPERVALLAQLLYRDLTNQWMQTAVLSSLSESGGAMFRLLANDNRFRNDPVGMAFLQRLADMIGTRGTLAEVGQVVDFLGRSPLQPLEAYRMAGALGEGLYRTRSSLGLVDPNGVLANIYATALALAVDLTSPELLRIEALRMVEVSPYTYSDTSDWLLLLCNPHPLRDLRTEAIKALGRYDDPRVIPALLERWPGLPPLLRRQAVMSMLERNTRVQFVVAALENGSLPKADLPSNAVNLLRNYPDQTIAARAKRLFGPVPLRRPELMEQFRPALRLRGFADHGRELFNSQCSGCHELNGARLLLGPDLGAACVQPKESLLSSILEPNAALASNYETYLMESEEGELVIGIKAAESHLTVSLKKPGAAATIWPKLNVRSLIRQNWSLMPDGFERELSNQDMADLLEFLVRQKQ